MKNEKIIESWNKIEPDAETKQKIFGDIMQKQNHKRKRPKFKNIMIIAAIMGILLILTSAAVYVYNEIIYYDMNGNISQMNIQVHSDYEPGSEEYEFEREFFDYFNNKKENYVIKLRLQEDLYTGSYDAKIYPAYKTIEDYEELKEYLQNNGAEQFSLPEYLPKGFGLKYANVFVTLINGADYKDMSPVYSEEKFGNIYEKYLLPEDQIRVERAEVYYTDGKMDFLCSISFSSGDIDNMAFGSSSPYEIEPEVLDIPQFERALIMSHTGDGLLNFNSHWTIKAIKLLDEKFDIFDNSFISKTWRGRQNELYLKNFETWEAGAVYYDITAWSNAFSNISRDEIIKIAESIK